MDVDPPFPFSVLPDRVLQTVGNAALHASLSSLQVRHVGTKCLRSANCSFPMLGSIGHVHPFFSDILACMQRVFIRSLALDYAQWATDADYRQQRIAFAAESDELIRRGQAADAAVR